ncbi:MAG: Fn3-like domain-containing protein [Actinobacteria bacterium]|nr:Fn3-like domain-containing protein [Actinomycetota bacterium]
MALLLEAKPALRSHPADVAQLLYNTAVPVAKATESGVTKYPEAVFRQGSGLVKASSALTASVTASPSVLELGEGTTDTVTITLTNSGTQTLTYTPTRVSGVSAAASTGSATHVGTTTPSYAYGQVGFTADQKTVTLAPGASADVTVTLTAPAKALKGKAGMLYGGWVQFTTTGDGNTVSVPFVGVRGDYQSVKLLNKFRYVDTKGKKWSWPRLGFENSDGELDYQESQASGKWAIDLNTWYPSVVYHLDYPASDLRVKVIDVTAKTSSWAILDNTSGTAEERTHWGNMPRDAAAQWVTFRGESWTSGDTTSFATDGHDYQLQLRVLKPLGDPDKSSDWESYTSPKFRYISE